MLKLLKEQQEYLTQAYDILNEFQYVLIQAQLRTGKTLITIALINRLFKIRNNFNILIVLPASISLKWEDEIKKYLDIENVNICKDYNFKDNTRNICILSYGKITRNIEKIKDIKWNLVICDEIHYINNRKTKRAKAMFRLKSEYRIGITATPIRNFLNELYSILKFFDKKKFNSYWAFIDTYFMRIEKQVNRYQKITIVEIASESAKNRLLSMLNEFSLSLKRKNFDGYVEKVENKYIEFEPTQQQKEIYNWFLEHLEWKYDKNSYLSVFNNAPRLTFLMNLLQICWYSDIYKVKSELFEYLIKKCQENTDRIIITGISKKFLILLSEKLNELNIENSLIVGDITMKKRHEIIGNSLKAKKFILLAQYKTISVGLNLYHFKIMYQIGTTWNDTENKQLHGRMITPVVNNEKIKHICQIIQIGVNLPVNKKVFELVKHKQSINKFINNLDNFKEEFK